jgi:HK97 family phage prohead protease
MATDDMMLERRYLPLTTGAAEIRADGEIPLRLSGYAALFNSASEPLPFTERIAPGAFTESLTRAARKEWEIRLLHGHDASQMLAATGSGSLRLNEDERGLKVEADLVPSEIGKHVALLVEREPQAMGFSFGFTIPQGGQRWNKDRTERTLTQVKLHEVSILTGQEPAYKATTNTAEVRALAERAGVDAERLSLAISALAWGNRLEEDDVMLLDAAVRQLTPRRAGGAPASVLGRLAELKKRGI